ncbi:lipocalin-like domain-containing protein [Burkholderia sp. MR1-5-21]
MRIPIGKTARTWLTVSLIGGLMPLETSTGWAQQKGPSLKQQLVGTWTFASANETRKDGTKVDRWGANPKGSLMFDANGRYMFIITRSDIPKFATNSATEGTAEEDKAVVKGMLVYFGTYSVNEADKTLITHIEGCSFPNLVGTDQKRIITSLTADELKYHNPVSSIAGDAQVVWKRAK